MAEPARIDTHGTEATPNRRPVAANSGGSLREALDDFLEIREFVATQEDGERALREQPAMVSRFHDVVAGFHKYGWGQSFHFAPGRSGEELHAARRREPPTSDDLRLAGYPHPYPDGWYRQFFPDWQPPAAPRETPPNVPRERAERPLARVASN